MRNHVVGETAVTPAVAESAPGCRIRVEPSARWKQVGRAKRERFLEIFWQRVVTPILFVITLVLLTMPAHAQNRGVYPLGMSAANSGVTPEPGFSYANSARRH